MMKRVNPVMASNLGALFVLLLTGATPSAAKECVDCHGEVLRQLKGNSHHIQGVTVSGRHCYACHWEATAEGGINRRYHKASAAKKASQGKSGKVDLVIWQGGVRPTAHKPGTTAVTFQASAIGTPAERDEIAKTTRHCLGCHSDGSNTAKPFAGDPNTPIAYAWDAQSVASRYASTGSTVWGKYSTATTNKKQRLTKAFSAHGNAVANQGGWSKTEGYDGDIPVIRGGAGARNVECFDCHNSHGSTVPGVTSSYRTFDGTFNGGILKDTVAGRGGYRMTYRPSVNSYAHSSNPFNAGAGLCFDCHETARAGKTPWGYSGTFGAAEPIMGYKDSFGFGSGEKGSTTRFPNRQSRMDVASSHLKAGKSLEHGPHAQINGLCTPCHDPHGISRTLGDKMPYAVPLLKGSWLTSPYREDGPPSGVVVKGDNQKRETAGDQDTAGATRDYNAVNREANANFGKGDSAAPRQGDYNAVNREANANFGKGASGAPREADFNRVNREANANFGKGESAAPRQGDYNAVNREANANFGKGASGAPREADFNRVNREANANFGKGESAAPRQGDYNAVNREANANFGKGASGAPREADYNRVNREANVNYGRGASGTPREMDANATNRDFNSNFAKSGSGAPREPMKGMKYNVDQNTFGGDRRITEDDDTFGGLCLHCHSKSNLTGDSASGQIHRAVKGWGSNKEHSFPCSKCHQPHNSGLPRLMQTNCFEQGPSGLRENSGIPWLPYKETDGEAQNLSGTRSMPQSSSKNKVVGCHVRQFGKATASQPKGQDGGQWKGVTSW